MNTWAKSFVLCLLLSLMCQADTWFLVDDFSDTDVDAALWDITVTSSASATIEGGRLHLQRQYESGASTGAYVTLADTFNLADGTGTVSLAFDAEMGPNLSVVYGNNVYVNTVADDTTRAYAMFYGGGDKDIYLDNGSTSGSQWLEKNFQNQPLHLQLTMTTGTIEWKVFNYQAGNTPADYTDSTADLSDLTPGSLIGTASLASGIAAEDEELYLRLSGCMPRTSGGTGDMYFDNVYATIELVAPELPEPEPDMIYTSYFTDFNGADGSTPEDWVVVNAESAELDITILNDTYYAIEDANRFPIAVYDGAGVTDWADYTVECQLLKGYWSPTTTTYAGVVARMQSDHYQNHYFAGIFGSRLEIRKNEYDPCDSGQFGHGVETTLVQSDYFADPYTVGQWWSIKFTVNGSDLSASLFDQDGLLVASVSTVDTSYTQGAPGVRVVLGQSQTNPEVNHARFDKFTVTPVAVQKYPFAYLNTFTDPNDTQPTDWTVLHGEGTDEGGNYNIRINNVDSYGGVYQSSNVTTAGAFAVFNPQGAVGWDNYTIECNFAKDYWSSTTGTWGGVIARANVVRKNEHYIAAIAADEEGPRFIIAKNYSTTYFAGSKEVLAETRDFNYVAGEKWRIRFTVRGDNLSAELYNNLGVLVASVEANDSSYPIGNPGVRAMLGSSGTDNAYWDNYLVFSEEAPAKPFAYETDFTGDNNTMPENWVVLHGSFGDPALEDNFGLYNNEFRMIRTSPGTSAPSASYIGREVWSNDYTVQSDVIKTSWNPTTSTWFGLTARQNPCEENAHYLAVIAADAEYNKFEIRKYSPSESYLGSYEVLAQARGFDYTAGQWWKISFTVSGSTLTAKLYQGDSLKAIIEAQDDSYSYGAAGARAYIGGTGGASGDVVRLDNFSVTSIPLPTTCAQAINAGYALAGDLNEDCNVDLADFALLTGAWLQCVDPEDTSCQHPWE